MERSDYKENERADFQVNNKGLLPLFTLDSPGAGLLSQVSPRLHVRAFMGQDSVSRGLGTLQSEC